MKDVIRKGLKFGLLTVLGEGERRKLPSNQKPRTANVKCECGNEKNVLWHHLKRNKIKSCGCVNKVMNGESNTRLGKIYKAMIYRCSPNYFESQYYAQKGITVCAEWLNDYNSFKEWSLKNGYDDDLTIDRINGDLGYSPSNCRWVDYKQQSNNRRDTFFVMYKGKKEPFMLLLDRLGLEKHQYAIRGRIKRGWPIEKALHTPIRN